jgi:plasmid maintenance system antidote protein VapI
MSSTEAVVMARLRADLRQCIAETGMSQIELADVINVTPKHLSQLLTGGANLTVQWATRIAEACGRTLVIHVV